MKMLAYGEDALTLWAINKKLHVILGKLNDPSSSSDCRVIFRPSFGRRGGENSPQFGEFDFIILAKSCLYLGESKWDRSSERIQDGLMTLREEQSLRHRLFEFYVREWAFGKHETWREFWEQGGTRLRQEAITKPIAPPNSLLATNLETILGIIRTHFSPHIPQIRNILLYFLVDGNAANVPKTAGKGFEIVDLNYSEIAVDKFIEFDLELEYKPRIP